MLHHYMAALLGMAPGSYWQISNNSHLYLENDRSKQVMEWIAQGGALQTAYSEDDTDGFTYFHSLLGDLQHADRLRFDDSLVIFSNDLFYDVSQGYRLSEYSNYIPDEIRNLAWKAMEDILRPCITAYRLYKEKQFLMAIEVAEEIKVGTFRVACVNWLKRRMEK
jgi:hypothetical protein